MNQDSLSILIINAMLLRTNAHLWHFQTRSFSEHEAFKELYQKLDDVNDRLAETAIGAGHFIDLGSDEASVDLFSVEEAEGVLDEFTEDLTDEISNEDNDPAVVALLEEMLTLVHQAKYKISMLTESVSQVPNQRKNIQENTQKQ